MHDGFHPHSRRPGPADPRLNPHRRARLGRPSRLHHDLLALAADYQLDVFTTQFGGLRSRVNDRFDATVEYDVGFMDVATALIDTVETASEDTCELCGQPAPGFFGNQHHTRITTVCDSCRHTRHVLQGHACWWRQDCTLRCPPPVQSLPVRRGRFTARQVLYATWSPSQVAAEKGTRWPAATRYTPEAQSPGRATRPVWDTVTAGTTPARRLLDNRGMPGRTAHRAAAAPGPRGRGTSTPATRSSVTATSPQRWPCNSSTAFPCTFCST